MNEILALFTTFRFTAAIALLIALWAVWAWVKFRIRMAPLVA